MLNWNDITIEKLQLINQVDTNNPIERTAQIVSILKELPYEHVETWTLDELRKVDLTFLERIPKSPLKFKFKHQGKRYRLVKNAQEMNAHHFIELQELSKKDVIEVLPEIIACLSYRVNIFGRRVKDDYEVKVEAYKKLPFVKFYTYALFFSTLFPKLLDATLTYLKEKEKEVQTHLDGLHS